MEDHLKEEVDTEKEEVDTEVKVKKEYVMTEARSDNLRRAREKALLLRQQLKEKKQPKAKPKSKMEQKIEELEAKTKDVVKLNDKDKYIKSEDKPSTSEIETPTQVEPKVETPKESTSDTPIEPMVKQDEPKPEPIKVEPIKVKLYRRENGLLYM